MEANKILGRTNTKLITCHIGNGASISAVENGKCINTSMGLTPNAGLIMGTRCADIDATIRVKESAELMGIQLLDHIIIGDGEYSSVLY